MKRKIIRIYRDIIQRIYDQQDEFFINRSIDRDGIFKRIRILKLRAKNLKNIHPRDEILIKQIDKAISVIDTILDYEQLYEVNIAPLIEMKEQLESLKVMMTLNC